MPRAYFDALDDLAEGKHEAAFERLSKLVDRYWDGRDSVPAEVIWYRALSAIRTSRINVAIADVERLVAREERLEEDSTVRILRANDYRYALALLQQRAGRLDTLLLELGLTLGKAGAFAEADSVMEEAAPAAPRDSRVPYYQGLIAVAAHEPTGARQAFTRFLAMAPGRYANQIADARRRLDALP